MNHPRHQLLEAERIIRRVLDSWSRFEETCADLDTPSDRLGVHGGDISDPVYAAHIMRTTWDENAAEVAEVLGLLRNIDKRVAGIEAQHPETARLIDSEKRNLRCADPVCDDLAVDKKTGLCFVHWQTSRNQPRAAGA